MESIDIEYLLHLYLQGMERLEEFFIREGKAVDDLLNVAKVSPFKQHVLHYAIIVCFIFSSGLL